MNRRELILMALCAPITGVGCATTGSVTSEFTLQLNNLVEASVLAWMQLDKQRWDGVVLVGKKGGAQGALKSFSGNSLPWPKRLVVRWKMEEVEGILEQEMDLPSYPLRPDGIPSVRPYLYLVFFSDRVLACSWDGGLDREIENKAKSEYETARIAGIPGARIIETSEGYKRLREESWKGFISSW